MAKVASSGAEEALATIDGAPRRNVKKSEAFVMSGDVLISLNRNVSSTYAKLLGDQLPPGTTVASSIHPHQLSRATASAGVSFPSMNRNGAAAQKLSRLPVSTSQIERRGSLARKTSEESSPTAIRMLKTAPIERMESTDVEESEEETVMMTTDEKENQKKPNENDDEVMVVDEEQFIDGPSRSPVYDDVDDDLNGSLDAKDMSNNSHQQSFRSPENYSEKDTPSKHSVVTIDGSGVSNHYDQDGMFSHVYYSTQDTTPKHGSPSLRKQIFESRTTPNTAASNSSASASPSLHATSESRGATGGVSLRSAESSNLNQTAVPSTSTNSVGGEREAAQIARNLYELKNCTSTQVADRLNEQNEFSFLILVKYLELFQFSTTRIDAALREFLSRVELRGESSARERLLRVFSARYLECNPAIFDSLDEVHTLTCALLLLNSDLHGPNMGKKMTARDFITNIAHTGCTFKREMLKTLFQSIKDNAISLQNSAKNSTANGSVASTSRRQPQQIYEVDPDSVVEYYSGFLMRKYVRETDGGKTPFGRRSWRMVYARLRGLVLYFDTDEHPKATSRYASLENAVSLHHALAEPAPDYKKKSFVFRVRIAHGGEILFQTSNQKELQEWCEKINFVAAAFSSPTLPLPVTSKPETAPMPRLPRIPCLAPITKQLSTHEARVAELNEMIEIVSQSVSPNQPQQLITDRWVLLSFEKRRYSTYINVLRRSLEARKASSATTMNIMMTPTRRQQQNQKPVVSEDRLSYTDAVNGAAAH
ncbi:Exchange factor for Arf-6 [Caenorhabditis elegans]|uniref:Isoform c of Exchange factor for Arf-6 n=1 Tax=Caenorhabditis elegans TaxID=6239 RepID=G5EET6-3|nr:Exchange factor for Arf-6 [Caenorhabditis elegans]ABQ42570.1 Y55D9A.1c [Caenorhabditis elegans]CAM82814.1 Exchange factor for Arf-6 [Caenorhabditis elegans]|eukprot:NP_001122818.1 Exchange factor for Arf-6 [Caenorhabditis elegans]